MHKLKGLFLAVTVAAILIAAPRSQAAQVSFSVNIGPQPVCPYGYFPYAPYNCAPYGYYGPAWFPNGFFIGAGPWFHGPREFHGYVDERFDPRRGYRGRLPRRGERGRWHPDRRFHGNAEYSGHGDRWNGHRSSPPPRGHGHGPGHDH
ncbi:MULTISPECIES: hypothetical protein [Acidobacterium]|uniref:Lipoprotein n=1 Tax=Acidobacterium capsulatum (strain ATCC 51196 / DSM 11244 / BCRC 80197 / JCM 7670 / NBRC 15755 / NCIMB 13165 / 161) TaxID=240015 RepID=C1FA69_ACIC5|nr:MULTISPECIES: hypothetical protein [Acidobacterium]ACO34009.1 hypothetical protein ACP_2263 [Acidobacterium capsulatum ATCC 51196]